MVSVRESYDIAFKICTKIREDVHMPTGVIVYPSAWYTDYFVITIRAAKGDVVELVRDYLETLMNEYPGWINTRISMDSDMYHIHFNYENS